MILLLTGCLMTMDGFFFDPLVVEAYDFPTDQVPSEAQEVVEFEAGDGTLLAGVWLRQEDEDAPVLVHMHGNKANLEEHFERIAVYWSWGYEVFAPDYRGYGMSQGSPTHDGVILDGLAAMELALEDAGAQERELLLHGTSLGGYVSVNVALEHPPAALVTEDLFSSAEKLTETNAGIGMPPAWMFEGAWDSMDRVSRFDEVPLLVVHGDSDTYIGPEHARWLYDAAVEPKQLWLVPGGNHGPAADSVRHYELLPEEYEERLSAFFEQPPLD